MIIRYSDMNIQFTIEHTLIDVQNIIFEQMTRNIPSHSHGSNCYEIHYISAGYGKLKANEMDYDICPNSLYVTGPHIRHAQTPLLSDPMNEYCIYLKLRNPDHNRRTSPLLNAFSDVPFWFGQDTQKISEIMQRLFMELEHKYTGYKIQAESLLSQMFICLVRNYEQHKELSQNTNEPPADTKSILIEEYFLYEYQSLSLETLAGRLRLSARQTQRLLQEYYGKNFQQKKTEARMSAAVFLLEDKEQSITAIAELLGYSSAGHFSSAFHDYYKISPRDYRKRLSAATKPALHMPESG